MMATVLLATSFPKAFPPTVNDAISAMIAAKIAEKTGANLQFIISALVASLTVGGKALGKDVANKNSTKIVHFVGTILNKI